MCLFLYYPSFLSVFIIAVFTCFSRLNCGGRALDTSTSVVLFSNLGKQSQELWPRRCFAVVLRATLTFYYLLITEQEGWAAN